MATCCSWGWVISGAAWVTLSSSGVAACPFPLSVPPDCIPPNCTPASVSALKLVWLWCPHLHLKWAQEAHSRPRGVPGPACEDHVCCAIRQRLVFSWKENFLA